MIKGSQVVVLQVYQGQASVSSFHTILMMLSQYANGSGMVAQHTSNKQLVLGNADEACHHHQHRLPVIRTVEVLSYMLDMVCILLESLKNVENRCGFFCAIEIRVLHV